MITVEDTSPPTITLTTNVISLQPANHKYVTLNLSAFATAASDGCDSAIDISDVVISAVSSDEPENNGNGDGNTTNDIAIAADCKSVQLRAERADQLNG
ncbi:MAG TPA: hypothetical protein VNS63_21480 [Blastocatellia bacterium]|nr:hypothetical protein [Blastocatellia bacterium]